MDGWQQASEEPSVRFPHSLVRLATQLVVCANTLTEAPASGARAQPSAAGGGLSNGADLFVLRFFFLAFFLFFSLSFVIASWPCALHLALGCTPVALASDEQGARVAWGLGVVALELSHGGQ